MTDDEHYGPFLVPKRPFDAVVVLLLWSLTYIVHLCLRVVLRV